MLYVTQQLRHALACCIASRLATCSHASVAEAAERSVHARAGGVDREAAGADVIGGEVEPTSEAADLPELLASLREEVRRASFMSELEVQRKVADLFELDAKYSAAVTPRSKVMWQLLHPEPRGLGCSAAALRRALQDARGAVLPDGQINARGLEQLKGGVRVCPGGWRWRVMMVMMVTMTALPLP